MEGFGDDVGFIIALLVFALGRIGHGRISWHSINVHHGRLSGL